MSCECSSCRIYPFSSILSALEFRRPLNYCSSNSLSFSIYSWSAASRMSNPDESMLVCFEI